MGQRVRGDPKADDVTRRRAFCAPFTGFYAVSLMATGALAEGAALSFYGTPGLIEMPSAQALPDGQLSLSTARFGATSRTALSFQITPRVTGTFRYSVIDNFDDPEDRFDRSFDLHVLIAEETLRFPAIAVGLRDFGGTGLLASEYIVATKTVTARLSVTGGIGWGRLGSLNGFSNPLGNRFSDRPDPPDEITEVGRVETDQFFRGDAALFAGLSYQATDKLRLSVEYSSDAYDLEADRIGFERESPFNFGLDYRFDNGVGLGLYALYGTEIGAVLSYSLDPANPAAPGGLDAAPPPIQPRGQIAAASWNVPGALSTSSQLEREGITLEALEIAGETATARIINTRYAATPQALGRTARVLANTLPPQVETLVLVPMVNGVPTSKITFRRSDLEELETALDGTWQSYVRADIEDAADMRLAPDADIYPRFTFGMTPYLSPALFDPDNPVRVDFGAQLSASYAPRADVIFSGALRQPLLGNLDESTRPSNSVLPRVRSDAVLYDTESDLELTHLTAEHFFRPGPDLYARLTAGYLERMHGGLSAELLWKPVLGPLALGLEINHTQQRDFDLGLGFQDYEVTTGHASLYYDFGNGYLGQLDAGRYLAGDYGATFGLDREFDNGFRVGAFFTLTDVSFEDFGEGSFDKGIRITVPIDWLSGESARGGYSTTIRPVTRDGGARLNVRNRLYEMTRGNHDPELRDRWGRFWR
ncbi:MAG: YjbH domain-containing protein [Pseudomonadota bacterium]